MSLRISGIHTVAAACGILGALSGASAQAAEGGEAVSYFPMIAGAAWTYDGFVAGKKVASLTSKMGAVSVVDGRETVRMTNATTVLTSEGSGSTSSEVVVYARTGAEVLCTFPNQKAELLQKQPLSVGSTWTYKGGQVTVESAALTTPFRYFAEAIKVTSKTRAGSTESMWFGKGVGLLRYAVSRPDGTQTVLELTRFTTP